MKGKIILLIVAIMVCCYSYGQNRYSNLSKSQIIDAVRSEFLNDTISKLVLINGTYLFKPDILAPESLTEFLDEVFVESKIKEIAVIDREWASTHFDGDARNGVVAILSEEKVMFSLEVLSCALNERIPLPSLDQNKKGNYYLAIDTVLIQLDSIERNSFNPKWIDKIELVTDPKYRNSYGNKGGDIYIYPKKRFKKRLLERVQALHVR
jgi:hypothetical protein